MNAPCHLLRHVLPTVFGNLANFFHELIPTVLDLLGELHERGIGFREMQLRSFRVEVIVGTSFGLCPVTREPCKEEKEVIDPDESSSPR